MVRFTALCLSAMLFPVPAMGESVLNFPRLSFQEGVFTGIAIVNPTNQSATVTFTAFGEDGLPLSGPPGFQNPAQQNIASNHQLALNIAVGNDSSQIFGAALDPSVVGWVQATSPVDGLTGFFLFLDSPTTFFDGADLPPASQKIIFNHVRIGDGFSTELNIFNPGSQSANLQVQLYGDESAPVASSELGLPAKGVVRLDASEFFEVDSLAGVASVAVTSLTADAKVAGFEVVRSPDDLLGLTARPSSEMLQSLFIPQLAVRGGIRTDLALTNYSTQEVDLVISAHQPDGSLYAGTAMGRTLAPNASLIEDLESFFPPDMSDEQLLGWVRVEATAKALNGSVSYTVPASGSLAAVASQPQPVTRAIFSQLATDLGFFTGLAMLNPGTFPVNLRVVALTPEGGMIGRFSTVLAPGQRVSKLIDELIPEAAGRSGGYFWVRSDLPVFLTGLFGLPNVLVNVPPQPAPTDFEPDGGLANLVVSPIQAFVQTNGMQTFTPIGAGPNPIEWAVNQDEGGSPQLGTIVGGNYTAPSTVPLPLPLVVTAETDSAIGGASLDVLDPLTVDEGLGQIQSIAFLQGLNRLYTAELTAAGGAVAQSPSPELLAPSTEIYENSAGGGSRSLIATFNGETISKILPLQAVDNREYLILANQTTGQIVRFRPPTDGLPADSQVVKSGLSSPTAMAFDVDGGILVFDGGGSVKVTLAELEAGLPAASAGAIAARQAALRRVPKISPEPMRTIELISNTRTSSGLQRPANGSAPQGAGLGLELPLGRVSTADGAAVDGCTGDVYFSDSQRGELRRLDRASGKGDTVVEGLELPGQLLGFYRRDVGCPFSFQLLVLEQGRDRVLLVSPSQDLTQPWIDARGAKDIIFLNGASTLAKAGTVVIAQLADGPSFPAGSAGGPGSILSVEVPDLYDDAPLNAPTICTGTISFAEFNLAEAVRAALDLDTGTPIPCLLAGQLTELTVQDIQIQNLQGLEFLTGLVHLNLAFNLIIDIRPLSPLVSLRTLELHFNLIGDISPISGLTALDTLDLDQNNIRDVSALAGLTSLTFLNLDRNHISDISPLANLTSLGTLGLFGSDVKDLRPLRGLVQLTVLNLSANGLSDISELARLSRLSLLALEGNNISDLRPLTGLEGLTLLLLRGNDISDISPLVENPGLGQGDQIDLRTNPLDEGDCPDIFALIERGVVVVHNVPCG